MRNNIVILSVVMLVFLYYLYASNSEISKESNIHNGGVINRTLPSLGEWKDNLLQNGDFEMSLQGWSFEAGVYWSDNGGEDGNGALLINPPEIISESRVIYAKSVEQCVLINGTSKYGIQALFRYLDRLPERPSVNRIHLYWYDSPDCSTGGQYGTYIEPNLEIQVWQNVFKSNLKPSLGAQSAQIRIEQRQDGNNNAEAIWDKVLFIEIEKGESVSDTETGTEVYTKPIGSNYLRNPTFDHGLSSWLPRQSPRLAHRVIDDAGHGGVIAATLPNERDGGLGTGSFSQCINIGMAERYELGAQVKVDPDSLQRGGGRLRATWYEGLDCKGRYRAARHNVDVDRDAIGWKDLHIDDLVPRRGSKSVNIGIVHSIDGKGEHTLLWDNFYFQAY